MMMSTIAPPQYIAPPGIDPHRFGIFSVAAMPEPSGRWELGVEWEPLTGDRAALRSHETCPDDYAEDVELRAGETVDQATPFLVVGSYLCKSASRPLDEARERAQLHLTGGEERAVEYAIATGAMGNDPTLAGATDLTPTAGTPVSLADGVALIEAHYTAEHHSPVTIHAPAILGVGLEVGRVARRQGQRLETLLGSFVSAGGGYPNEDPTGTPAAAGEAWLYGTGRPTIRRSEVFVDQPDDHLIELSTNDVAIMAQRAYLVSWDGPTVAVLVDAPGA